MPDNRILIVDDQRAIAEIIAKVAESCGYTALVTTDAACFLERVDDWAPTHIVVDLVMPEVDGIEVLRHLAARQSTARIIIASGLDGKTVDVARRLAIERHLDLVATLLKPFRRDELLALLAGVKVADWCTPATLRAALARDELLLYYQPKIDVVSGAVVGLEALVRWLHPERGLVLPDAFLPVIEENGLVEPLTDAVMQLATAQLAKWGGAYTGRVALKLSNRGLSDLSFPDRVAQQCSSVGVAPERIELELTESCAMADPALAMDILGRLRLKGFSLSLDDFGTGFSSLSHLARLPFSEIKIDKSFVIDCATSHEAPVIIRSIVDLAHNLNLRAVADGVEHLAAREMLAEFGCDLAQGRHIAEPMPADCVLGWLDAWQRGDRSIVVRRAATVPAASRPRVGMPLWTKPYDGSFELQAALSQLLYERMSPLWDLGRNSLVGWRPKSGGIEVLMVPYRQIADHIGRSPRLLQGRRMMGDGTFEAVRELAGGPPIHVPLPFHISDTERDAVPVGVVEQVLRRFGITETRYRGVALFDIVGFSRFDPSHQIAQLNSLECSLNSAQKLMQEIGHDIDLARTSTGDGFYIWNRDKGPRPDIDTYLLTLLALADNAIAQQSGGREFAPELRTCFAIGPHYSYFQIEGLDPRGHDYIVGNVTISLARMAEKCLPRQILIRDFNRPSERPNEPTNPIEFMIQADGAFGQLAGASLQGCSIDTVRCYLTGTEHRAGEFNVSRYTIRDKHGFEHAVFNQKLNLYLNDRRTPKATVDRLFLGKQQADLAAFDASLTPLELSSGTRLHS
jgi:EAL domain-containing protein (putative c-di-GMP-specific phosphodiesterase class I)/ActR/RegA family two-component response regulator